jgi:excisionase family DNA binding protein
MKMLSPIEVARILSVRQPKVREWLNKGTLRGWKVGRIWRVLEDDLQAFIRTNMNRESDIKGEEDPILKTLGCLNGSPLSSEEIDEELYGNI